MQQKSGLSNNSLIIFALIIANLARMLKNNSQKTKFFENYVFILRHRTTFGYE